MPTPPSSPNTPTDELELTDLASAIEVSHDPQHTVLEYRCCRQQYCRVSDTYVRGPARVMLVEESMDEDEDSARWMVQLGHYDPDLDDALGDDLECQDIYDLADLLAAKAWVDAAPNPNFVH